MVKIKQEILDKLRCTQCNAYLSCMPVMLKSNGMSICGRCQVPEEDVDTAIRNEAYEDLATIAIFPCRYDKEGCKARLTIDQTKEHEETCTFQKYICPAQCYGFANCSWMGTQNETLTHFENKHSNLITTHPFTQKPDINKDNKYNMLLTVFGVLFLVQVKCDVIAGKLWHWVRFLGDQQWAHYFKYILEISSKEGSFTKTKQVLPKEAVVNYSEDCLETNIDNLLKILGNYENVHFEMRLSMDEIKCAKCSNFSSTSMFQEGKGFCCIKCMEAPMMEVPCKNKEIGCPYIDSDLHNLDKHQWWFCKYQDYTCESCKMECFNRLSPWDHWIQEHDTKQAVQMGSMAQLIFHNLSVYKWMYYTITAHDATFHLAVYCCAGSIMLDLVSNLPVRDTENYDCTFTVSIPSGILFEHGLRNVSRDSPNNYGWDWSAYIKTSNTALRNKLKDSYNIKLKIKKLVGD